MASTATLSAPGGDLSGDGGVSIEMLKHDAGGAVHEELQRQAGSFFAVTLHRPQVLHVVSECCRRWMRRVFHRAIIFDEMAGFYNSWHGWDTQSEMLI
jgi:hypothetical protein